MISANFFSVFLKYLIERSETIRTIPIDNKNPGKYSLLSPPNIDHLKPSITPTIGFNEYIKRHFSGITALLKPTGEIYKPNCTIKGIMYLKSRYFTLSAVIKSPKPIDVIKANSKNNGRYKICQLGVNWYQTIKPINIINDIKKSTKLTIIELAGIISLGKYTFEIKLEFVTKL